MVLSLCSDTIIRPWQVAAEGWSCRLDYMIPVFLPPQVFTSWDETSHPSCVFTCSMFSATRSLFKWGTYRIFLLSWLMSLSRQLTLHAVYRSATWTWIGLQLSSIPHVWFLNNSIFNPSLMIHVTFLFPISLETPYFWSYGMVFIFCMYLM